MAITWRKYAGTSNSEETEASDTNPLPVNIRGLDESGVAHTVLVNPLGRIETVSQPYAYGIAEGEILNHSALLKFGTKTTVAANTQSLIWEGPTAQYVYLTSAQQLKVSSTSANDTVAGTGARTLTILGLDTNYDEISETINLNGVGVVTTTLSFIRVFRSYVDTFGTYLFNEGIISIKNNAGTVTQALINANDSQTLIALWTVPRGKSLFITNFSFSTDSNKGARISLFSRQLDGGILYPWRIRYRAYIYSGNNNIPFQVPFKIPEKTDLEIRVLTPAGAGNTSCGATFEGWYETN